MRHSPCKTSVQLLTGLLAIGLFASSAAAEVRTKEIPYDFEGETHIGILAYDDTLSSTRPGILVVHEWTGRGDYPVMRAKQLAAMGYVAFAADYYGGGKSTTDRAVAGEWSGKARNDLDRFQRLGQAALDVLAKQQEVNPEYLGAIGFCFGGTASLQLAYAGAPLDAIVSFHGGIAPPRAGEAEAIQPAILICHGAADPHVKREDLNAFREAMEAAGVDYEIIEYGHAVHAFTNPEAGDDPSAGAAYQERAALRSWAAMIAFFGEHFLR